MKKFIVITTINEKTDAVRRFAQLDGWHVVIVGDNKTPPLEDEENLTFLSVQRQKSLGYEVAGALPYNHYTRKNIGYVYAMRNGAKIIYDTDDDNVPYANWGEPEFASTREVRASSKFINIYKYFTDKHVWPRGFPLDEIRTGMGAITTTSTNSRRVAVWQGLADNDPDVDAIYRLTNGAFIEFDKKEPVHIPEQMFCPFNSQNTFWIEDLYPALYLPATVSFRLTDILRGYVAQRIMWELGYVLGYMGATVYQERNEHDLMRDFRDEIDCYVHTKRIVEILESSMIDEDVCRAMRILYAALGDEGIVKREEEGILECWLRDVTRKAQ